jgi:hypothetical protein
MSEASGIVGVHLSMNRSRNGRRIEAAARFREEHR